MDCCLESIGAVSLYQWRFAPLRGRAIDKTCHLRFWVIKQSNDGACSRRSLCCRPCLVWRAVAVIAVRAYMVVRDISEFLHGLVQFLICSEFIELGTFILQGVEVPFHWRIVVGVSGFAHALYHMDGFAEFYECLRCILAPLVAVQEQASLCQMLGIQCLLQSAYSQVTGNVFVCYTGDYTSVMEMVCAYVLYDLILPNMQQNIKLRYANEEYFDSLLAIVSKACESAGNKSREFLNMAMKEAVIQEYIRMNPIPATKPYPRKKPTIIILKKANVKKFLKAAYSSGWYLEILLGLFCGLRKGEISGLKFGDFDAENRTIYIQRQITSNPVIPKGERKIKTYEVIEKPPKTDNSYRLLRIPEAVANTSNN